MSTSIITWLRAATIPATMLRLVPTSSVVVVAFLVLAVAMVVLRYRISKGWIDLRTTELPRNRIDPNTPHPNQNKTVIITGGNAGLGYHVAHDLAVRRRFGTIVLGCRDVTKGRDAADRIARDANAVSSKDSRPCHVECVPLDLSSLQSVVDFTTTVKSTYRNIHALVLNAGVWVPMDKKWKTSNNYEIHFGVNHLAHQLLAQLLLPYLQQQNSVSNSRIVWVTSSLLKHGRVNLDDPDEFMHRGRQAATAPGGGGDDDVQKKKKDDKGQASAQRDVKAPPSFAPTGYCDSKIMNALACRHMAESLRLEKAPPSGTTITTYAVCPGFCRTDLGRYAPFSWWKKLLLAPIFWIVQRPAQLGAQGILYCILEDPQQLVNGGLYRDGRILWEDPGGTAYVDQLVRDGTAQRLWDLCSSLLKDYLPETK